MVLVVQKAQEVGLSQEVLCALDKVIGPTSSTRFSHPMTSTYVNEKISYINAEKI